MNPLTHWRNSFWLHLGTGALAAVLAAPVSAQERKTIIEPGKLPANIRAAVEKAVPDGVIWKVERELEGEDPGQYDVYVRLGGREYEVEVSPTGEIIEIDEKTFGGAPPRDQKDKKWTDSFHQEHCTFATVGRNRYFVLEPGHQLVLQSAREKVAITVQEETRKIGDVETRVVEEREEENGKLKEVSRNFFAICKEHGDVFYFGEEVDIYRNDKIVKHEGAWRADEKDSKAGILMPGTTLIGARHYQEIAPNAMDRAEILRDDVTLKTPAGEFKDCLKVEETSGLNPSERDYKIYAPGIGLVQDEDLLLTSYRAGKGK
ncbi:MAG TPA: hypothetical protein VJZ71_06660 [Phycisphaerae bacterium]|nr:hypothetical protein [Phycisphaerae bacterium]